jgi:hypothetical protein
MTPHRCNSISRESAHDLVALTVVVCRWHRTFLQALAAEQGCTSSRVLRAQLDRALGPLEVEEPDSIQNQPRILPETEQQGGRCLTLEPRLLGVLAAVADQRAVPLTRLVNEILGAWLLAHVDVGD